MKAYDNPYPVHNTQQNIQHPTHPTPQNHTQQPTTHPTHQKPPPKQPHKPTPQNNWEPLPRAEQQRNAELAAEATRIRDEAIKAGRKKRALAGSGVRSSHQGGPLKGANGKPNGLTASQAVFLKGADPPTDDEEEEKVRRAAAAAAKKAPKGGAAAAAPAAGKGKAAAAAKGKGGKAGAAAAATPVAKSAAKGAAKATPVKSAGKASGSGAGAAGATPASPARQLRSTPITGAKGKGKEAGKGKGKAAAPPPAAKAKDAKGKGKAAAPRKGQPQGSYVGLTGAGSHTTAAHRAFKPALQDTGMMHHPDETHPHKPRPPPHPPPHPGRIYPPEAAFKRGDRLVVDYAGQEEEDEDAEFEVDCIMDEARVGDHRLYLIKWKVGGRFCVSLARVSAVCACVPPKRPAPLDPRCPTNITPPLTPQPTTQHPTTTDIPPPPTHTPKRGTSSTSATPTATAGGSRCSRSARGWSRRGRRVPSTRGSSVSAHFFWGGGRRARV